MLTEGLRFGFVEGVIFAQRRMKMAIKMTKPMPMRRTAHQKSVTH